MLWLRCCGCIYDTASPKVPPFLPAGAAFTAIKSLTGASGTWKWRLKNLRWKRRGPSRLVDGLALKKDKKTPQNNPEQPGFTVAVRHPTVWDLWPPKGGIIIHATLKKTTSPKISFEGAALPATYLSRLNVLAYCTWAHGWSEGRYFLADCGLAFILTLDAKESRSALSSDSICVPSLLISEWS